MSNAQAEEKVIMDYARSHDDLWREIEEGALQRIPKRLRETPNAPLYAVLWEAALLDTALRLLSPRLMYNGD